jgi:hypothetical protein
MQTFGCDLRLPESGHVFMWLGTVEMGQSRRSIALGQVTDSSPKPDTEVSPDRRRNAAAIWPIRGIQKLSSSVRRVTYCLFS